MYDCCALIVNPTSGKYTEARIGAVIDAVAAAGLKPQLFVTRAADDCPRLARELCERHRNPLVIVGGGDGTINGVANGLVSGKATLAVLPLGTANVLAKELGIRSVDDAVSRIVRGESRVFSIGQVKGDGVARRFVLMAGVGFDARVVRQVRNGEKKLLKQGAYLLAALRCVASWEKDSLDVALDGGEPIRCHSVVVCNAASYGGPFRLAPEATIFTPGFSVVCVTSSSRAAYIRLALDTVAGRVSGNYGIRRMGAGRVSVSGTKDVQVDGDSLSSAPLIVEAVPEFGSIIV